MRKAKKRSSGKTKYIVTASIILLTIVIITVVVATNFQPPKPKASEYFNVVAIRAMRDTSWGTTNPNAIAVKSLYLNVTPVMGDAHEIYISYEGASDTIGPAPTNSSVLKGHTWEVAIQFGTYTAPVIDGNVVFEGLIAIESKETAKSEPITITLPLDKVL